MLNIHNPSIAFDYNIELLQDGIDKALEQIDTNVLDDLNVFHIREEIKEVLTHWRTTGFVEYFTLMNVTDPDSTDEVTFKITGNFFYFGDKKFKFNYTYCVNDLNGEDNG